MGGASWRLQARTACVRVPLTRVRICVGGDALSRRDELRLPRSRRDGVSSVRAHPPEDQIMPAADDRGGAMPQLTCVDDRTTWGHLLPIHVTRQPSVLAAAETAR